MNTSSIVALLEIAGTAFAGGSITWIEAHVRSIPSDGAQWRYVMWGALFAGFVALYHRFRPVPSLGADKGGRKL